MFVESCWPAPIKKIKIGAADQDCFFSIIAGILLLGQLRFAEKVSFLRSDASQCAFFSEIQVRTTAHTTIRLGTPKNQSSQTLKSWFRLLHYWASTGRTFQVQECQILWKGSVGHFFPPQLLDCRAGACTERTMRARDDIYKVPLKATEAELAASGLSKVRVCVFVYCFSSSLIHETLSLLAGTLLPPL